VVFVIHGLVGERLLQYVDQPSLKSCQIFSIEFGGQLLPYFLKPHAEICPSMVQVALVCLTVDQHLYPFLEGGRVKVRVSFLKKCGELFS